MLRIAICDDSLEEQAHMGALVREYKSINAERFETELFCFGSAFDMLAALDGGLSFDIILLDVMMPGLTGLEAAREMRSTGKASKIIFLTSSPEFAVESYDVEAFYYALKPIWKEKLFVLLDKAVAELNMGAEESLLIKSGAGITRILLSTVEFIEVVGRKILYLRIDKSVLEAAGSMNETQAVLARFPQFLKIHRSYIVNLHYIDKLTQRNVKMSSGLLVPLPKANYPLLKEKYLEWSFDGRTE